MTCRECGGPATIRSVSPAGVPAGDFCQACWDENRRAYQIFVERLEAWLGDTPQAQMAPPFTTPRSDLPRALVRSA